MTETTKCAAETLVRMLLEQGQNVEVEYRPTEIDSMPHIIWMIRAMGAGSPTQYLDTGTAHNRQDAEKQVAEKARILGVTIAKVTDRTNRSVQPSH